nr:uncharacterized protein LOC109173561 [Ipomoea batatas]
MFKGPGKINSMNKPAMDEGTKVTARQSEQQGRGVMKPAAERDFNVKGNIAPERGNKPNYLDNNPMGRMMNGDTDGGGNAGKLKEAKAQTNQTGPPPVCENVTVTGPTTKNVGAAQFKAPMMDNGKGKNVQAGRAQQGNQWSMFRGKTGAEGAPNAGKAKDQGGAVPRQQQTVNQEGPQGQNVQKKGNGGVSIREKKTEGGDELREEKGKGKQKEKQEQEGEEWEHIPINKNGGRGRGGYGEGRGRGGRTGGRGGYFCGGGAYSVGVGENLEETRAKLKQEVWSWCRRMKWENVIVESDMEVYTEGGIVGLFQNGDVVASTCKPKVNCLAKALADRSEGQNVFYGTVGSLPSGFQQLLSLEGIPHFGWVPGRDWA